MAPYNPSAPETLGIEWLVPESPSTFVLDSAAKAYGQYLPGAQAKRSEQLAVYAEVVSGVGVFGAQVLSAPYVDAIPQDFILAFAGTDTGASFASATNGNAAWLTQASGAATYASVSPGVDDVTYLRNVNQLEGPTPARMMLRGAGAESILAGRRVLDVEVWCRVKCTLAVSPTFFGCVNLADIDYVGPAAVVPVGQGYVDLRLVTWALNPATLRPWTRGEVAAMLVAGATDEFGFLATWDARYTTTYADQIRVSQMRMRVRWQAEDRLGYASGQVEAPGWQTWASRSVPNLLTKQDSAFDVDTGSNGTWAALANTTLLNVTDDPGLPWTRSLRMTSTAGGVFGGRTGKIPAIAGKTYAVRTFSMVTSGRPTTTTIEFYDAAGTLLGTSASTPQNGTGAWQPIGMTAAATAPTGTTQMDVLVETTATAGSQTCYITGVFLGLAESAMVFVATTSPGGAGPSKVDGGQEITSIAHPLDELRVMRRILGPGIMSIPTFGPGASAVGMPLDLFSYRPTLQDPAGALLTIGPSSPDCTATVTTSLAGWDTANGPIPSLSQVYATRVTGRVNVGNTIEQELTLPVETYLAVRLVVAGEVDVPAADLVLRLRRRADNVQVGGDVEIAPTDLERIIPPGGTLPSRTTPQVFIAAIPTPAANTAAQHYVEASSTAPAGSGWVLYAWDTLGYEAGGVSVNTISFANGVDAWTNPGDGGETLNRTGMITVQTAPAPPQDVTAVVDGTGIDVGWDPTGVGVTHLATEVWRNDDRVGIDAHGYQQIADLRDESLVEWHDPEVRRGVPATYLVRTRRIDGSVSEFSVPTSPVTVPASLGPTWLFTSAEAPASMWVAAEDLVGDQRFRPPIHRVIREFFGRDGAVAFLPLENPLDQWDGELALYWAHNMLDCSFLQDPPVSGRAAFDKMDALSRAPLSYVCLRDNEGNRWFANIAAPEFVRHTEGSETPGGYIVELEVRELTRVPSTPIGPA